MMRNTCLMVALASATLLAACGGGGEGPAVDDTTVPASALATPEAFTAFAAKQVDDEQREPLSLDGVVPPTSETDEPAPVAR